MPHNNNCTTRLSDKEKKQQQSFNSIITVQYTNLGIDSTESERSLVRGTSKDIYQLVNLIDETTGDLLLKSIDS